MYEPVPFTDAESEELAEIARKMLTIMQGRMEGFCREHGRVDPRDVDLLMVVVSEVLLTGLLITTAPEELRVPVMRKISHNVQETLRARAKLEVRGHA
jgi:hypothetical protein